MSDVGETILGLTDQLPVSDVELLARVAAGGAKEVESLRSRSGSPALRAACGELLVLLGDHPADYLAGVLEGIAVAVSRERRHQQVDVVWTGPESDVDTSRLTAAVVVDLIDGAQKEVLVVSFASQPEPRIAKALEAAVARGVEVTLLLERSADNHSFWGSSDAFGDLPAIRLHWPSSERLPGAALHVKAVVVDGSMALVGSANITSPGMERNLECGILIRGGPAPTAIRDHIWSLYRRGTLRRA